MSTTMSHFERFDQYDEFHPDLLGIRDKLPLAGEEIPEYSTVLKDEPKYDGDRANNNLKHQKELELDGNSENDTELDQPSSWIAVLAGFLVQMVILGILNNVGALNSYWVEEFGSSQSEVAWAGSINMGMMFLSGPIVSFMIDKTSCQTVGMIGSLISFLGFYTASYSINFPMIMVFYGFVLGFGASCLLFASLLVPNKYFKKRLSTACGIITAGSGCGSFALSFFNSYLFNKVGWRIGMRYLALFILLPFFFSFLFKDSEKFKKLIGRMFYYRQRKYVKLSTLDESTELQAKASIKKFSCSDTMSELFPFSLLKSIPFLLYSIGCFIFIFGYFVPYIHLISFAQKEGIDPIKSSYLLGALAICSLLGKVLIGPIKECSKVSELIFFMIAFINMGVADFMAILCKKEWHFFLYAIYFGLFDGVYVCLVPPCVNALLGKSRGNAGTGLLYALKSFPMIVGAPLAGLIYDKTHTYTFPFIAAGASSIIAFLFILASHLVHKKSTRNYVLLDSDEQLEESQKMDCVSNQ